MCPPPGCVPNTCGEGPRAFRAGFAPSLKPLGAGFTPGGATPRGPESPRNKSLYAAVTERGGSGGDGSGSGGGDGGGGGSGSHMSASGSGGDASGNGGGSDVRRRQRAQRTTSGRNEQHAAKRVRRREGAAAGSTVHGDDESGDA